MRGKINEYIKEIEKDIISWRRYLHENPELSNQEKNTSNFIVKILKNFDIEYERQSNNYGIVAKIKGNNPGKKIAFRADMDALPIQEENNIKYKSKKDGVMHACGHDSHMAILLGTICILNHFKYILNGEILFIFQPAEENSPTGGAKRIIESKVLEGIDRIYGLHVWPEARVGEILVKKGPFMAASDHFFVSIKGKSTHAAQPNNGIDALVAAANWITSMQSVISREIDPLESIVFTIGTINGGTRYNVVAENVLLEGTCRTFKPDIRDYIENRASEVLKGIDVLFKTKSRLDYRRGYCSLMNNDDAVEFAKGVLIKYLGEDSVKEAEHPSMCAEDFAFYLKNYNGAFLWLGTGFDGNGPLHSPIFNIDEKILKKGVLCFCSLAIEFLK